MTKYVCTSFSLQMIRELSRFQLDGVEITEDFFFKMTRDAVSYMRHEDLAERFHLPYNRSDIFLKNGDVLYVAQYDKEEDNGEEIKPLKFYQVYVL